MTLIEGLVAISWLVVMALTTCSRCKIYCCCLLSYRYTLALLRLLCFLPIGTYLLITMYAHILATHNVFGAISLFMIIDLCTFCKALSCMLLWIKASAK